MGLMRIDVETGTAIDVNPDVGAGGINALAMGLAANGEMYLSSSVGNWARLYSVDLNDGTIQEISSTLFERPYGLTGVAPIVLGDANCDGVVDLLDVGSFVESISTGVFNDKADITRDGQVNLLDVQPFVQLLSGG